MSSPLVFFREFLKNPSQVSSVLPTSRHVATRLARRIAPHTKVIVEFGPGTGVLATAILKSGRLDRDGMLILIEKSETLAAHLKRAIRDPRVKIVHDSAEHVQNILAECGAAHADYIFTSIPLTIMPKAVGDAILSASLQALGSTGELIVFLFNPRIRGILLRHVERVSTSFEPLNFPPMIVCTAKKKAVRR